MNVNSGGGTSLAKWICEILKPIWSQPTTPCENEEIISLRSSIYPLEVFALWLNYDTGVIYIEYLIIQPVFALKHFAFMCSEAQTCRDQESELSDHEWIVHTSDYSFMVHWVLIPDLGKH